MHTLKKGRNMKKEVKLVVYSDDKESIVCQASTEKQMLNDYFSPGTGRDLSDYARYIFGDVVAIRSRAIIDGNRRIG